MKFYRLTDRLNFNEVVKEDNDVRYIYRYGVDEWICSDIMNEYILPDGIKYGKYVEINETEAQQLLAEQRQRLNDLLNIAIDVATKAHKGQLDKGGNPYILHPEAVANALVDTECKIVAYLHDVCEDSDVTFDDLTAKGFTYGIVNSVRYLTKSKYISYDDYLKIVKNDYVARQVKISDLKHNMDIRRISNPTKKDYDRIEKYKKALAYLEK